MCGRFANDSETNELIEEFVAAGNDYRDWIPQYSIAPTEVVPIVRERRDDVNLGCVLSNSFGFGGTNASVVLKRLDV